MGGEASFYFIFVSFLYIFHISLSSWHVQLLGAAAGRGGAGLSLARGVHEGGPHGLLPPYFVPATPCMVAPSHGGSVSPTPACPSRLVLLLSSRGGSKGSLDLAGDREWVSPLRPSPSSRPIPVLLKDAIVPVPEGVPVPYLHAPLTWTPLELWCLLLQAFGYEKMYFPGPLLINWWRKPWSDVAVSPSLSQHKRGVCRGEGIWGSLAGWPGLSHPWLTIISSPLVQPCACLSSCKGPHAPSLMNIN